VSEVADVRRLPKPVAETWDWQLQAACRDADSEVFFHPEDERGEIRTRREERAKAACRRCPVLDRCRQHALSVHEPYGIWGGMTVRERAAILASRKQTSAA
jgi:WhiB family redox-sensing transcriptional regulator